MQLSTEVVILVIVLSTSFGAIHTIILNYYSEVNLTEFIEASFNVSAATASSIQEEYLDVFVRLVANTFLGLAGQLTETQHISLIHTQTLSMTQFAHTLLQWSYQLVHW